MRKSLCLLLAIALLLGVWTVADATTVSYTLNSGSFDENADGQWAKVAVSGTPTANISSYTFQSATLTIDTDYPNLSPGQEWEAKVAGSNTIVYAVSSTGYDSNGKNTGTVTFDFTPADFTNTISNWYSSDITFYVEADCEVYSGSYTVTAASAATPEPGTVLLLGLGLFGLAVFRKKSKKA